MARSAPHQSRLCMMKKGKHETAQSKRSVCVRKIFTRFRWCRMRRVHQHCQSCESRDDRCGRGRLRLSEEQPPDRWCCASRTMWWRCRSMRSTRCHCHRREHCPSHRRDERNPHELHASICRDCNGRRCSCCDHKSLFRWNCYMRWTKYLQTSAG